MTEHIGNRPEHLPPPDVVALAERLGAQLRELGASDWPVTVGRGTKGQPLVGLPLLTVEGARLLSGALALAAVRLRDGRRLMAALQAPDGTDRSAATGREDGEAPCDARTPAN
ncbi:hypothetical protein [Streptomyces aidingensis]|uniref:Uncharacterized protein n=1 Tax=Streptomyces aidingensis TaxID=910347 RepID=A0A1I1TJV9_9ACTN|nr:hypothetical protein [Streptomyces aidingensis]SFD58827.1 hypothetical protein SAMN05421773_12013 [Streptomyces aidingensis]